MTICLTFSFFKDSPMFGKLREATAPRPRDERNMRAARRQLELFMDDGIRERITVALALLDENVESRESRRQR